MISVSLDVYGGGNKLFELAKISVQPEGASPTGESKTKSGKATNVSSKRDFTVCRTQIIMSRKHKRHFSAQAFFNHVVTISHTHTHPHRGGRELHKFMDIKNSSTTFALIKWQINFERLTSLNTFPTVTLRPDSLCLLKVHFNHLCLWKN